MPYLSFSAHFPMKEIIQEDIIKGETNTIFKMIVVIVSLLITMNINIVITVGSNQAIHSHFHDHFYDY